MSWEFYRPYVSAAERRQQAERAAKKLAKQGQHLQPVQPEGRKIATTFWGKAWCDNLESYSDFENRLPRGRSYLSSGAVIDLRISSGKINALVQGTELYKVTIKIDPLSKTRWQKFKSAASGKVTNLLDLLQGKLSKDMLTEITAQESGLFPAPNEIHLDCSCPDWADVCKHVAAVMYGVGTRLDSQPELFFTLRGVDMQELVSAAATAVAAPARKKATAARSGKGSHGNLANTDLSELFGVEIEDQAQPTAKPARTNARKSVKPKAESAAKRASKQAPKQPTKRKRA